MRGLAALLLVLAPVAEAGPTLVAHDGEWTDGQVLWETGWRADRLVHDIRFAAPLPGGSEVVEPDQPVLDAQGRIVGVEVSPARALGSFQVELPQSADRLAVPLVEGPAVQRVTLHGMSFRPDDALGFEKHIRYWAPASIDSAGRKRFEQAWRSTGGRRASPTDQAVYLRVDDRVAAGIPGTVRPAGQVSLAVHGLLGITLVGLLALSALLYRSLERLARTERNDAYIRRHLGGEPGVDAP